MNTTSFNTINEQYLQHTLRDSFTCVGRGLHTGLRVIMTLMPAEVGSGIVFYRRDVTHNRAEVHARWNTVTDTRMSTTISNNSGTCISTIEHLMAALHSCGIDNARIVIDAPEVPIMDGSAGPFVELIQKIGKTPQDAPRQSIVITKPISIREGEKFAGLEPFRTPYVNIDIHFSQSPIGHQKFSGEINEKQFAQELASARTFGFKDQIATMKKLGLARGGSIRNAVLIDDGKVLNQEGLRYNNEFARHKALDAVGDLSLLGVPIIGKFSGRCSGHKLNNALLHELMLNESCWLYTTQKNAHENWPSIIESANSALASNYQINF